MWPLLYYSCGSWAATRMWGKAAFPRERLHSISNKWSWSLRKTFQAAARGNSEAALWQEREITEQSTTVAVKAYWQAQVSEADDDTPPAECCKLRAAGGTWRLVSPSFESSRLLHLLFVFILSNRCFLITKHLAEYWVMQLVHETTSTHKKTNADAQKPWKKDFHIACSNKRYKFGKYGGNHLLAWHYDWGSLDPWRAPNGATTTFAGQASWSKLVHLAGCTFCKVQQAKGQGKVQGECL